MPRSGAVTKVKEIKAAIKSLPARQRSSLFRWLEEVEDQEWDRQIASDVRSGKLKRLLDEVDGEISAGKLHRMP